MLFYADKDIRHLLLINPDNPSGNFIPLNELMDLLAWTQQRNIHLILDESFVDFSEKSVENTLLKNEVLETYPHLTVIKKYFQILWSSGITLGDSRIFRQRDNILFTKKHGYMEYKLLRRILFTDIQQV